MTCKPTALPELAVLVDHNHKLDRGCTSDTLLVSIVKIEAGKPRNESGTWFDQLFFTCCFTWRTGTFETYGWDMEYRGYQIIELRDAERHVKTLRRVEQARKGMLIQPANFGQYVTLMAAGLGIRAGIIETEWERPSDRYEDHEYRVCRLPDLEFAVNRELDRLRGLVLPEKAEVAS